MPNAPTPPAAGGARVLRFPVRRTEPAPIIAWYRCAQGCGALVASKGSVCLACCVEDRE